MAIHADHTPENQSHAAAGNTAKLQSNIKVNSTLLDNRPEAVAQRKLQETINNKLSENDTGLPDQLKSGIESLSGYSMDDVRVHYNSSRPAQLQAHAYAQGSDIHIASGQEKHLPHEAWHVVQQKQGRVKPTVQLKGKIRVNDKPDLEKEADVMGEKALIERPLANISLQRHVIRANVHQRVVMSEGKASSSGEALLNHLLTTQREKTISIIGRLPKLIIEKILDGLIHKEDIFNVAEKPFWDELKNQARAAMVDTGESVKGMIKAVPFTHNTSLVGALGILGTGVFTSNAEDNVNFRHDIDSRYAGGVTLMMKHGFEDREDTILHDLYHKSDIFLREASLHVPLKTAKEDQISAWKRLLVLTTSQSNFRGRIRLLDLPSLQLIEEKKTIAKLLTAKLGGLRKEVPEIDLEVLNGDKLYQNLTEEIAKVRAQRLELKQKETKKEDSLPPIGRASSVAPVRRTALAMPKTEDKSAKLKINLELLESRLSAVTQRVAAAKEKLVILEKEITRHKKIIAAAEEAAQKLHLQREAALLHNSSLSLANPQVRMPRGNVKSNNIDHILLHRTLYDKVIAEGLDGKKTIRPEFEKSLVLDMAKVPGDTHVSGAIATAGGAKRTASKAMLHLESLLQEGRVHRVDGPEEFLSHKAGRLADKSRGRDAERELRGAAATGMEIHPDFFDEKMNNSPGAYSAEAFHEFQKVYYKILISQGLLF